MNILELNYILLYSNIIHFLSNINHKNLCILFNLSEFHSLYL